MEKRNKKIWASGVAVEHTELDDLFLDIHKQLQQDEGDAAEASEANNKKLGKERREQKKLDSYRWSIYQKLRREEIIGIMIFMSMIFLKKVYQNNFIHSVCIVWKMKVFVWKVNIYNLITLQKVVKKMFGKENG